MVWNQCEERVLLQLHLHGVEMRCLCTNMRSCEYTSFESEPQPKCELRCDMRIDGDADGDDDEDVDSKGSGSDSGSDSGLASSFSGHSFQYDLNRLATCEQGDFRVALYHEQWIVVYLARWTDDSLSQGQGQSQDKGQAMTMAITQLNGTLYLTMDSPYSPSSGYAPFVRSRGKRVASASNHGIRDHVLNRNGNGSNLYLMDIFLCSIFARIKEKRFQRWHYEDKEKAELTWKTEESGIPTPATMVARKTLKSRQYNGREGVGGRCEREGDVISIDRD